ncbi:MAG: 5-aminolevulic acid synthase, partial [Boseongicola sp.]|nr:5-aminolevulic acid synthase [Boseongicola sp.]
HNVAAADRAALSACNKARKSGTSPCKLAARVLPKGYQSRALTLSQDATSGFTRLYKLDRGARAMAISPTTGAWGIGASDADAIRACKGDRALKDCKVVVRD